MRFITEFELVSHIDEKMIENFKANGQFELGRLVADSFDWQNVPFRDTRREQNFNKWTLEIEAFPMDKWVEFKRQFFVHLGATGIYEPGFKALFEELESFGNPVTNK